MKKIETLDELEKAIDAIDWDELHLTRLQYDNGFDVWLYYDDENDRVDICIETQSTCPGRRDKVFAILKCNLEIDSGYSEGWATKDEEGEYETEDGRTLTAMDMASECIQYGDFSDMYEIWRNEIIKDFENELLRYI